MVHFTLHLLGISYEVRRNVTAVELHTFNHVDACSCTLCFFNGNNAFFFHLLHCLSDELTNFIIVVCRNACHVFNLVKVITNFLRLSLDAFHNLCNSLVDTTLNVHRISSGSNILQTGGHNCLSEQCCSCCAVTGIVTGLRSNLLNKLRTHILELVLKFNLFCNTHTIFGDVWSTKLLFKNHVATFRAKCHFHRICQCVNTFLELFASLYIKFNFFCHN